MKITESGLQDTLKRLLGIPAARCKLGPELRGEIEVNGIVIEKWLITAEPGSKIPVNLYRPRDVTTPVPAVVQTCGHGGSKGVPHYTFVAQVYARLGIACLNADPIGEEERNPDGEQGTREHDRHDVAARCEMAGRSVMGKFIFDAMRTFDFLESLDWVDVSKLGVIGNSLGGAIASWLFVLEPRLRMTIASGWALSDFLLTHSKHCTAVPYHKMRAVCEWDEFIQLAAEQSRLLMMNGDTDAIIDQDLSGTTWHDLRQLFNAVDPDGRQLQTWFCSGGGHRPYQVYKDGLLFTNQQLGTPAMTAAEIAALPELNYGEWCDQHGIELEKLYGTDRHLRGATLPDMGLHPIAREDLAVLAPDEIGSPDFTIDGWLKQLSLSC